MDENEVLTPIIVEKEGDRYKTFSIGPTLSQRDMLLMLVIKELGGININVKDGKYFFNATLSYNEGTEELEYETTFELID